MKVFLGIDQGTHASRALLFDDLGRQRQGAWQPVELRRRAGGRVEQDPLAILNSVQRAIAALTIDKNWEIQTCGIASQRSTVLAWHCDGTPLGPALSWQDVRAAGRLQRLAPHAEQIHHRSGLPLSPHFGASKLSWLSDRLPALDQTKYRLSPLISFIAYHLLEERPYLVDHGNAQRTQLLDIETLDWSHSLLDWFAVPKEFLPVCKPISHDYGRLVGSQIPVLAINGDQNAAFYGAGQPRPDTALINLGSGAFILRKLGPSPLPSRYQLTTIGHSNHQRHTYLREATINGAGSALDWAQRRWRIPSLARLPRWLESIKDPPVFINGVGGLASPWWQQDLSPVFLDLGGQASVAKKLVAVVESIVFMVQANLDLMTAESPLTGLEVSGGLSQLQGLCQRLANLSGLTVCRRDNPEATARGAAWLAAGQPATWRPPELRQTFEPQPDPGLETRYQKFYNHLEHFLS